MRKLGLGNAAIAGLCALLISACGGGGGFTDGSGGSSSGGTSSGGTTITPANLRLVSSATALPSDADTQTEGITLSAIATDADSNTLAGVTVAFTATSGAVTVTSATTDATGTATAVLTTGGDTSVRTINVTAKAGSLTATPSAVAVQVVAPTNPAVVAPGLGNGTGSAYVDQVLGIGQATLAAGGSTSLHLDFVDRNNNNATLTSQTPGISFSSPCISAGRASVSSATSITGGALDATYIAKGCNGNDTVTARASLASGSTLTATGTLTVQPAALGSIKFDSATPKTIGLKGSGLQETSIVKFQLFDASGGAAPSGVDVSFALNTTVGGITRTPATAQTDAQGFVQTVVNAGSVATPVRVTATATGGGGQTISSQSEQLTISTTIPDQNSFSLSVTTHNIDADSRDGVTTTVNARLSDRFNNPVPDGTAVLFTTEGGSIQPRCETSGGACSVVFTSQEPRTSQLADSGTAVNTANGCGNPPSTDFGCNDHRYTILATAIGEESFTDSNSNGQYDSPEPFVDLGEAFTDANENGSFDSAFETYVDFDGSGGTSPTAKDGKFTGTLCNGNCSTSPNPPAPPTLNVRGSQIIVMSSSGAVILTDKDSITLPVNGSDAIKVIARDTAENCMAAGTTVSVTTTYGSVADPASYTQPDSIEKPCTNAYLFTLLGATSAGKGNLFINVTAPSGLITTRIIPINP
jgi:hypothetical protein